VIDVPMYFARWQADVTSGKELFGVLAGLHDVSTRWAVTHDFSHWKDEIAWMSLYFSVAVWSSLGLCSVGLVTGRLPHYLKAPTSSNPPTVGLAGRIIAPRAG